MFMLYYRNKSAKGETVMTKIIAFFISLILFFEGVPAIGMPTLKVDAGNITGETTTRATGFL